MGLLDLKRRKAGIDQELVDVRRRIKFAKSEEQALLSRRGAIKGQITVLQRDLIVSDHAIVRYMERVADMDIESVKQGIVERIEGSVRAIGAGKFPLGDGLQAVVKDNVVVTIET